MTAFLPELSAEVQAFVRAGYGVLLLLTLIQALPEARRFFLSERWGGYAASSRGVDTLQNPIVSPLLLAVWVAVAVAIVTGYGSPWPALANLALCRYFFIHMRWKSVLRGMGAPGFMSYWTGLAVFLLEYTSRCAPDLRSLALLVLQVDLAFIMLSAGVYKFTAGYPQNHGMELGLCNPMWGYWWRAYSARRPDWPPFWTMNQLAWGTEVAAALLMLVPPTRELGAFLLIVSFFFILTQIRLGFLCEMVMLCGVLFVASGSAADQLIASITGPVALPDASAGGPLVAAVNLVLGAALWAYLVLLPFAHAGLYHNFYARRSLPPPVQVILTRYTNAFGMIIWRVFSIDLVNFFIRVHHEEPTGADRTLVAPLGSWPRFNHVGEMICLTSLFTTMKYYPSNDAIFRERLLRYARTVPRPAGRVLVFEYFSAAKRPDRTEWVCVAEYRVDTDAGTVDEALFDGSFSARAVHPASPIHEAGMPGSYAPRADAGLS